MPSSVKIQEGEFGREPEPEAVTNKLKLGARECLYFYGGRVVGGCMYSESRPVFC